eukprot:CAMPEP_0203970122 /NCGR_PEP_ID=MMETSP0359-20131031/97802_1 /ASSEMBLY_ACC=CAM_ASM_000338 /TAXON_ID=268821 /ORGANISM="Scrippsiella Hangoei, Strain SHTV-5" /LENGTH=491 /DNA_ID=CAMNT_0050908071 /DNA_START=33 /DNA_END=1508 /DNA_ORIENTATION=+
MAGFSVVAFLLGASLCFSQFQSTQGFERLRSFTVYSERLLLRPGEVHNAFVKPVPLPEYIVKQFANKTMHLQKVDLDIVRVDGSSGKEEPLPLTAVYNHHHAMLVGTQHALEGIFNRSRGHDPLGPNQRLTGRRGHPDHGSAEARALRPRGCMMHGAAVNEFLADVAEFAKGGKVAAFGGASGAEFRGTSTALPAPYTSASSSPESFMGLLHFINMRGAKGGVRSKRFECPCTSARKIDPANGTVDGQKVLPFECSLELLQQGNTGCSLSTYIGGYRCCEHGVFLSEDIPGPEVLPDELRVKYTFTYYDEELVGARPVRKPSCCDATGNETHKGNIEYDVPRCPEGSPPEFCEHVTMSVQPFDLPMNRSRNGSAIDPDEVLELVHAWGHQHVGALGMELFHVRTGQLLCRTRPQYGNGSGAGDESGFVVGIPPCVWGPPPLSPPPRIRRGDLLRTMARYNSSEARHGVMSLWLMDAAPLAKTNGAKPDVLV